MMTKNQASMESAVKLSVDEVFQKQAGRANALMNPSYVSCNYDEKKITIEFPVLEWELNRAGVMHGGIISTAFDFCFGILSRYFSDLEFAPTISLDTTYLRVIPLGDRLIINAEAVSIGKSITHLSAEGYLKKSGKLAAIARASYFNADTTK